jgi:predicted lipoprotein with Yx(FWY)xxD motif
MIVTYNHMPLYYWVNDMKAGDTTGQGVGSVWYVVNPDGEPVGR